MKICAIHFRIKDFVCEILTILMHSAFTTQSGNEFFEILSLMQPYTHLDSLEIKICLYIVFIAT